MMAMGAFEDGCILLLYGSVETVVLRGVYYLCYLDEDTL